MKKCSKCLKTKDNSEFNRDSHTSDGYFVWCRNCQREYRLSHKKRSCEYSKRWRSKNVEQVRKSQKNYRINNRDKLLEIDRSYTRRNPWRISRNAACARCNDKNHVSYKWYGGRGIKFLLTTNEVRELWFRDKACLMKRPSIDRRESDGHYELSNCRFIELSKNVKELRKSNDRKNINVSASC